MRGATSKRALCGLGDPNQRDYPARMGGPHRSWIISSWRWQKTPHYPARMGGATSKHRQRKRKPPKRLNYGTRMDGATSKLMCGICPNLRLSPLPRPNERGHIETGLPCRVLIPLRRNYPVYSGGATSKRNSGEAYGDILTNYPVYSGRGHIEAYSIWLSHRRKSQYPVHLNGATSKPNVFALRKRHLS